MKPYYEDRLVRLYHADCRDLLPLLGRNYDLMLTDPPYEMDYQHGARKGGVLWGMDAERTEGDDVPFDPSHLFGVASNMIVWGGNHFASRLPDSRGWLVWLKRDPDGKDQSEAELAWTDFLTTVRTFRRQWDGSVRGGREQGEGRVHVNQKPVALMAWCLAQLPLTKRVIDPYTGSGATLIACKEAGIQAVGIEKVERNCAITASRLSQECLDFGDVA